MAYNLQLADRVRAALMGAGAVEEKRMFGGLCFMVNGKMCVTVGDRKDHQMMVRVGPEMYDKALKRKGVRPAIMGGREFKGYVFLAEEGIKTKKDLDNWVGLALDFNRKAKQSQVSVRKKKRP